MSEAMELVVCVAGTLIGARIGIWAAYYRRAPQQLIEAAERKIAAPRKMDKQPVRDVAVAIGAALLLTCGSYFLQRGHL